MAFVPALGATILGGAGAAGLATSAVASTLVGGAVVAGATAGVVGTVKSVKSAKAASATAIQVAQAQVQQQKVAVTRQRRQAVRSFIRRRSQLRAAAAAGGIQGSGVAGGLSSLSSQFGANLGFGSQMGALSSQITSLSGLQATQQAQSGLYSNISSLGFGFANAGIRFAPQIGQLGVDQFGENYT